MMWRHAEEEPLYNQTFYTSVFDDEEMVDASVSRRLNATGGTVLPVSAWRSDARATAASNFSLSNVID